MLLTFNFFHRDEKNEILANEKANETMDLDWERSELCWSNDGTSAQTIGKLVCSRFVLASSVGGSTSSAHIYNYKNKWRERDRGRNYIYTIMLLLATHIC